MIKQFYLTPVEDTLGGVIVLITSVRQWSRRRVQSHIESYQRLQKMVLDATLLKTQYYKVRIMYELEQSQEPSSAFPYTCIVAIEKRAFWSPSTKVANFTYFFYLLCRDFKEQSSTWSTKFSHTLNHIHKCIHVCIYVTQKTCTHMFNLEKKSDFLLAQRT